MLMFIYFSNNIYWGKGNKRGREYPPYWQNKKSKADLFNADVQSKARKNNINLNFKGSGNP